jgi:hypothetical protein
MLAPFFADFAQGMVGLGQMEIEGSTRFSSDVLLPRQPKKVALNAYLERLQRYSRALSDRTEILTMSAEQPRSVPGSGTQFFMSWQKRLTYDGGK